MDREEALNKVRQMSLPKETMEILEALAPELAESKDERIRRWLCDYFSSIDKAWIHKDITCIDILRWLEKQKEQKKEKFPPYVTGFKGHPDPAGTSDLEEAAARYERENRQSILSSVDIVDAFIAGAEWQKEQKPAEWSEEDEEILKLLILNIGRYMYFGGMSSERILSFLKSLRPSWKPGDEQMKALKEIVNILAASPFLHQNDYLFNILNGLREELKKLL